MGSINSARTALGGYAPVHRTPTCRRRARPDPPVAGRTGAGPGRPGRGCGRCRPPRGPTSSGAPRPSPSPDRSPRSTRGARGRSTAWPCPRGRAAPVTPPTTATTCSATWSRRACRPASIDFKTRPGQQGIRLHLVRRLLRRRQHRGGQRPGRRACPSQFTWTRLTRADLFPDGPDTRPRGRAASPAPTPTAW